MGLVLSAVTGKGWTTGSGMEGPPESAGDAEATRAKISTFPWSLFTKSPRRRMLVAFTCNICSQRTTRAVNPHAYSEGTVFVQVSCFATALQFSNNLRPEPILNYCCCTSFYVAST